MCSVIRMEYTMRQENLVILLVLMFTLVKSVISPNLSLTNTGIYYIFSNNPKV